MAGLGGLLNLARDALAAQSFGLDVTGQNVTNVNTPGYVRRTAVLEARPTGTASFGGVDIKGLRRAFDRFVDGRLLDASGQSASADARSSALGTVEAMFNDTAGTGLGAGIAAFFGSLDALAANPSDPTTRGAVLARAAELADRIRGASDGITKFRGELATQAEGTADEINSRAGRIAKLNQQIALAQANGGDAADLEDQRDDLLGQLSELVDVHTFIDGQNQLVVRSAGTTLVEGGVATSLAVSLGASGDLQITAQQGTAAAADVTSQVVGGRLGGLREARDVDAPAVLQNLDRLAYDLATAVNARHATGYGLDGQTGRQLFSVGATPSGAAATIALDPAMVGHPERVAAASTAGSVPGGSDQAVALAALASQPFAAGGARTVAEAYSDLVGDVGQRKAGAARDADLRDAMKAQTKSMRDSASGVSLDEEMVNLSRYQRAYEAATKLLQTADQLLAGLIQEIK